MQYCKPDTDQDSEHTQCIGNILMGPDGPDRRYLRPILDTIASCLNIGVALLHVDDEKVHLNLSSYQNPFLQLLRQYDVLAEAEAAEVHRATQASKAADNWTHLECSWLDPEGRFAALIAPCRMLGLNIMVGPVIRRNEDGSDPLSQSLYREKVYSHLEKQLMMAGTGKEILEDRIKRFMSQRSAIDLVGHERRARDALQALETVLETRVHVDHPTADFLEALTKSATFWTRRRALVASTHTLSCSILHRFSDNDEHPAFELNLDRIDSGQLMMSTGPASDRQMPSPDKSEQVAWSQFCDEFRTCRHLAFHEQLTLMRLWMQEVFTGATIRSEDGVECQDLYNQLAARIAHFCGADVCVLHRYLPGEAILGEGIRQGYLDQIGFHVENDGHEIAIEAEFDHLQQLGSQPEIDRLESACYRCIQGSKPKRVFIPVVTPGSKISSVSALDPTSVLTVPLVSRGRVWGVLELLGRKPGQLQNRVERWAAEVARIITQPLYDQWMAYHVREMSAIAARGGDGDGARDLQYAELLDHVRRMLLASSARLFVQDMTRTKIFRMAAHSGHGWDPSVPPEFDITDPDSQSAEAMRARDIWRTGEIGKPPFDVRGTDGRLDPLREGGHLHIALVPIKDTVGNYFASLMVTSMDDEPFPSEWEGIVEMISAHLTVILEQLHLQSVKTAMEKGFIAHSVKTRIHRVEEGGDRLLHMMGPLYNDEYLLAQMPRFLSVAEQAILRMGPTGQSLNRDTRDLLAALKRSFPHIDQSADRYAQNLHSAFEDLKLHLDALRVSAVALSGGRNTEHFLFADPASWNGTPATLRECLKRSIKPLTSRPSYRNTLSVPPMAVLDHDVRVRVPEQIIVELLNNIFDNAFKYDHDIPSVSVMARTTMGNKRAFVEIRNAAPALKDDEADRIASGGVRADYAFDRNKEGSGIGLKWCYEMAKRWGFVMEYLPARKSETEGARRSLGTHLVRLTFDNIGR